MARRVFRVAAFIVAALVIFNAGMYVGYRKAAFTYRWSDNYYQNFAGPSRLHATGTGSMGMMLAGSPGGLIDGHGLFGTVMRVDQSGIVIEDRDGAEKVVAVPADALIREQGGTLALKDLKQGDKVVILGQPEASGQVTAHLVRVLPSSFGPMEASSSEKRQP